MLNEQVVAGAQSWRPRTAIALLLSYFGLFGLLIGSQGVLWAEVVRALSLSKTVFGTVQLVAPLLSVVLLLAAGRIDRVVMSSGRPDAQPESGTRLRAAVASD